MTAKIGIQIGPPRPVRVRRALQPILNAHPPDQRPQSILGDLPGCGISTANTDESRHTSILGRMIVMAFRTEGN